MATDELSAEEIHKLKQFSHALPDEQDKLEQLKNVDIDAIVDATGVSRRNVLQVILGLAAGGVVGGLSAQEIVQAVEADASTTDSDGNVGLPGDRVDVYADGIDSTSLSTETADITNESLIKATADATVSIGSAGTWTSPSFGTVDKDERGEFSSDSFKPDQTGWYWVSAYGAFDGTVSDQDRLQSRLQNVTDNSTVFQTSTVTTSGSGAVQGAYPLVGTFELVAGKSYKYQTRDIETAADLDNDGGFFVRSMFR